MQNPPHTHLQFLTYTSTLLPLPLSLSFGVCPGLSAHDRVLCVPLNHCNTHTLAQGYKKRREGGRENGPRWENGRRKKRTAAKDLLPNSLHIFFTSITRGKRATTQRESNRKKMIKRYFKTYFCNDQGTCTYADWHLRKMDRGNPALTVITWLNSAAFLSFSALSPATW